MANRTFYNFQGLDNRPILMAGSFAPNGTGAISDVKGRGFSAARTGVGTFEVTLDEPYPTLLSATSTLQLATPDDKEVQQGPSTLDANNNIKKVSLVVWDKSAAAAADVAANANNRINFVLVLNNSTIK